MHRPRLRALTTLLGLSASVGACGDDQAGTASDDGADSSSTSDGRSTSDGTSANGGASTGDGTSSSGGTSTSDGTSSSDGTSTGTTTSDTDTDSGDTMGNAAPMPTDDAFSTDEDVALTSLAAAGLLANDTDPDGDPLTVSAFDAVSAQGGTVAVDPDGAFTYTPAPDFNGDDSFSYTADDGQGGTTTATVAITVEPVNDAPVAVEDV